MPKKPTLHDKYITKREWLIDTAETPKDKKNLKADLAKLQAKYMAAAKPKKLSNKRIVSPSKMTPSQKADYLKNPDRYDPLG